MNRRSVVRLQLLILAALVVAVAGRKMWMSSRGADGVEIEDIKPFEVHRVGFHVPDSTRVLIDVEGSLEHDVPDASLATEAWILQRKNRRPVWRLVADDQARRRGTRISRTDEIALEPGMYDAYFASVGNDIGATLHWGGFGDLFRTIGRFFGQQSEWEHDADRWHLSVQAVDGQPRFFTVGNPPEAPDGPGVVWRAAPMHNRSGSSAVLEVLDPVDLDIYSIGEITDEALDYGWIQNLSNGERVWELRYDNSAHAGGYEYNRLYDGKVNLDPGIYLVSYETDADHGPDHWRANPPFDPQGWGMTLRTDPADTAHIRKIDLRQERTPIVDLTRVGSGRHEVVPFTVNEPVQLIVDAVGELSRSQPYDYGWIQNASGERIWEMKYADTFFAGGRETNREALAFVSLAPGDYTAHFQTDDSHAFTDWSGAEPRRPESWGMALFPIKGSLPDGALAVMDRISDIPAPPVPGAATHPPIPAIGGLQSIDEMRRFIAVQISGVGNDANYSHTLSLDAPRTVVVVAEGEIVPEDRFDYAWIERADDGDTVWAMTWENTMPAGGDERNRMFAGSFELPAGDYVVRYRSDPSHAFGDFGKIPPHDPSAWGVSVIVPPNSDEPPDVTPEP